VTPNNLTEWSAGTIALAKDLLEKGTVLVGIATLHKGVSDEIKTLLDERVARKGPQGRLLLRRSRREDLERALKNSAPLRGD